MFSSSRQCLCFLHVCTSPKQETAIFLEADVEMNDAETITTKAQVAAREEFTRPSKKRQQRRVTAWGAEQTNQFDPGGLLSTTFSFRCTSVCLIRFFSSCVVVLVLFCFLLVCKIFPSRYERREYFSIKDGSDWDARTKWMSNFLRLSRTWSSRFASTERTICTTLPTVRLMISTVASRYSLHFFEMIVAFVQTDLDYIVLNPMHLECGLRTKKSFEIRSTLVDKQVAAKNIKLSLRTYAFFCDVVEHQIL